MTTDPRVYLSHILESIGLVQTYTQEIAKEDFLSSQQVQDAVIRRIEVIGEATKNLPAEFKENWRDVPWRRMAGMRDVLIHEYFGVDLTETWKTVQADLPELKEKLSRIMEEIEHG